MKMVELPGGNWVNPANVVCVKPSTTGVSIVVGLITGQSFEISPHRGKILFDMERHIIGQLNRGLAESVDVDPTSE